MFDVNSSENLFPWDIGLKALCRKKRSERKIGETKLEASQLLYA